MTAKDGLSTTNMDEDERLKAAWDQLNLVLSFFSRIDTKLSVVLGLDLAMLAVLSTRLPKLKEVTLLEGGLGGGFFILLAISLFHLYRGTFPDLKGGTGSLLFFCSIAKRRENEFKSACASRSKAELTDDVLEQVWRNSKILSCKFASLQRSYELLLGAGALWVITIGVLTMK